MKTFKIYLFITLSLFFSFSISSAQQHTGAGNLKYVDPTIGNVGHLLQPTRPTVQQPNQMIRMYPQRVDHLSDQISNFPLNIVSHRLGEVFSIKPTTKVLSQAVWNEKQTFDHDLEITRPWYYSSYLIDEEINVEYTPGKKTGIFRFKFPEKSPKSLLFGVYNNGDSEYNFISGNEVLGVEIYHGNIKVYMYGKFNIDVKSGVIQNNQVSDNRVVQGIRIQAWVSFPETTTKDIEFRYAISYVSADQARKNFNQELVGVNFNELSATAEKSWGAVIDQIKVVGGTEAQKRSFYTALYRCYERMVDITEGQEYFSGFDNKVHQTTRPFYVDDWTWDTYLAHHPLRTILNPEQEGDMLNSFVSMYNQSGWMPTFPVLFGDHACMNGFHSTITFLDAYRKGIRGFDIPKAYEGMLKNANAATMLPWKNGPKGPLDDFYHEKGYYPALKIGEQETDKMVHNFEKRQAVALTLGHSYDDWALGEFAKELGVTDDWKKFSARANNYKNLWDLKSQMFIPKDNSGNWIKIDPKFDGGMGARDYYDENNGWTYLWQVQHDIPGLINLMGSKLDFEKKLDQHFREGLGRSKYAFWAKMPDATGLVGQFSMGNEPSFHIPYLYNFTSSPWKTQKRVRFLLDTWFKDNVFGIPGDEDGGGMTAFVVFSSMGFYPVTPGVPLYTIGSPLFEKVSIDLKGGKQFQLIAEGASVLNKYIQSATFNGEVLDKAWFTHQQLMSGGTLKLVMGPKPNKNWGQ